MVEGRLCKTVDVNEKGVDVVGLVLLSGPAFGVKNVCHVIVVISSVSAFAELAREVLMEVVM